MLRLLKAGPCHADDDEDVVGGIGGDGAGVTNGGTGGGGKTAVEVVGLMTNGLGP